MKKKFSTILAVATFSISSLVTAKTENRTVYSDFSQEQKCITTDEYICEFFTPISPSVRELKENSGEFHLVFGAMYSSADNIEYVNLDVTLIDQDYHYLTKIESEEFFGFGSNSGAQRITVKNSQLISQELVDNIARSESLFIDAWAFLDATSHDDPSKEVIYQKNVLMQQNKNDLLNLIANYDNQQKKWLVKNFSLGEQATDTNKLKIEHPINNPSTDRDHENYIPSIVVCLNRNYGDCDYDRRYDSFFSTNLTVPFKGNLEIAGKVLKIYGAENYHEIERDFPDAKVTGSTNSLPTNIYLQMSGSGKKGSLYPLLGRENVSTWYKNFPRHLEENLAVINNKKTIISWDVPKDEGVFGTPNTFGWHRNVTWMINLVLAVEIDGRTELKHITVSPEESDSIFNNKYHLINFIY